jgi:hypothetical protein
VKIDDRGHSSSPRGCWANANSATGSPPMRCS